MLHRSRILVSSIASALTSLLAFSAHAQNTWDASSGADFDWSNPLNWSLDLEPTAADNVLFPNPVPNPATLPTPGTITLGTGEVANSLSFDAAYTLTRGDLSLTSGNISVSPSIVSTISSALGGSAGVTKQGNGALILSGTNTFAGGVFVNGGTLSFGALANLGAAANTISLNGGTLQATNATALDLGASHAFTIGASNGTIDTAGAGALTLSGAITLGTGSTLTKTGTGTLILTGTSTYTGNVAVNQGTLQFGAAANLGANAGSVSIENNAVLRFSTAAGAVNNAHPITVASTGGTFEITGTQLWMGTADTLRGSGVLTVRNAATPVVNAGNLRLDTATQPNFNGSIVLESGGSLEYGFANVLNSTVPITVNGTSNGAALTSGDFSVKNGITSALAVTSNGGILSFNNGNTGIQSGQVTLASGTTTIGLRDWFNLATVRSGTISGNIVGPGNLAINSGTGAGGTVTFSGTNTYAGTTSITASTAIFNSAAAIGGTGASVSVAANGIASAGFAINQGFVDRIAASSAGTIAFGTATSANNLDLSSVPNVSLGATTAATYTGTLTPASGTYRLGGGTTTLTFTNANALTGANNLLAVTGGTTILANSNNYTGTTTVNSGATLQIGNGGTTGGLGSGALVVNGTLSVNRSDNYTFTTAYTGTGNLNQAGTSVLNLGVASNSYPRLTFSNSGRIDVGAANATVGVDGGNSIQVNNGGVVGTVNASGGGTIRLGFNASDLGATGNARLIVNAPITNGTGTGLDIFNSGNGTVVFNGANTYTGNTNIQSGSLSATSLNRVVGGSASSSFGAPTTVAAGTINIGNGTNTAALIYTGAGETTDRVINLASGTGGISIEQAGSGVLGFSSAFTAGTAGAKTLTLNGSTAGTGLISGAIVNSSSGNTSLTKSGTGTWTLRGANGYTGTTSVTGGTLALDFANAGTATNIISASSPLALGGGTLSVIGKASTINSQTFASTAVNAGGSVASITNDATANDVLVDLKAITRNAGGTVSFVLPANGTISATNGFVTSSPVNASGILGGYATVGSDWATKSGNNIVANTAYTPAVLTGGSNTTNYLLTAGAGATTLTGATVANSLKIVDTGTTQSLALATFNLTLSGAGGAGGLMYAGGTANAFTISGGTGTLTAGANDLIINTAGASSSLTISAIIAGSGGLTKSGNGTLLLTNTANTFTGNVYINGGVLAINAPVVNSASSDSALLGAGNPKQIILSNNAVFRMVMNGANNSYNPTGGSKYFVIGNGGGTIDLPTGITLTLDDGTGAGTSTTNAQLQGSGTLTKTGAGTLQLGYSGQTAGGFNNFTGHIVINGGTLNAGNTNALGSIAIGTTTVNNGGVLDFNSTAVFSIGETITINGTGTGLGALINSGGQAVTLTGPVTLGSASAIGGNGAGGVVVAGPIDGAFALSKAGSNIVTLTNVNSYSGGTSIGAGILRINDDAALGASNGAVTFTANSTLQFTRATTLNAARNIVLSAGTATFDTGPIIGGASTTVAGVISGPGALLKKDTTGQSFVSNPLILSGANTFTGNVAINSGAVVATNSSSLGLGPKTITISPTTNPTSFPSLQLDGSAGNIILPANLSFTTSYDALNAGVPIPNGGAIVNLAGDNVINGNFNLTSGGGGTTFLASGGTLTVAGNITSSAAARLVYLRGDASGTLSGILSDVGANTVGVTRDDGAGTWTLSGTNTYTGATTITEGTLLVTGSIAGSATTLSGTGILGGTGTTGAVTVNAGGTVSPGASIGTLQTGALTLNANSVFSLEVNSTALTTDLATVTSLTLDAGNTAVLNISDLAPSNLVSGAFVFLDYSSWNGGLFTVGGNIIDDYDPINNAASASFLVGGNSYAIDYNYDGGTAAALVVVPEPGAVLSLLGGLSVLAAARRPRRRA